jgi:peptide/nickel transport system substrate-binding protein
VAAQLAEVGIDVTVNAQSRESWSRKVRNRDSDFFLEGVFAGAEGAQWVLTNIFKSDAQFNPTGYANPRVDELITQLEGVMLGYGREALIEEAWKIVLDDIVYVPLHNQVLVWAMRGNFDIPLQLIDWPRFEMARFKESGGE